LRTERFSEIIPGKVKNVTSRKEFNLWGDSLSLKFNEKEEKGPDLRDESETLTTSQIQCHPKVGRNIWVDVPILRTSGTFLNSFASRNQEFSTVELNNKFHLSMMEELFKSKIPGSSHNNPNIDINKKTHERRLIIDQDLFQGLDTFQEQRTNLAGVLNSIPKPSEGNSLLRIDEMELAAKKLKHPHPKLNSSIKRNQIRKTKEYKFIWKKYWKEEEKVDLELESYRFLKYSESDFELMYNAYLVVVKEILVILPFKEDQPLNQGLDHPQEMRKAMQAYQEFKKIIEDHRLDRAGPFLELIHSFYSALEKPSESSGAIMWKFIEFWMKKYYHGVWKILKGYKGEYIPGNVKSIFNGIFIYGIENMTKQICVE
jgi:hypothetical protein